MTADHAGDTRAHRRPGQFGEVLLFTLVSLPITAGVYALTVARCDTSPSDDPDPSWRFSTYCRALHAVHLFNIPDSVFGGGLLNLIFVVPPVAMAAGGMFAVQGHQLLARRAFRVAVAWLIALLLLGLLAASATFHGV